MEKESLPVSDRMRMLFGLIFGLLVMLVAVQVFTVNDHDHLIVSRGVRAMLSGVNPWAAETKISGFYNPPFSILFLWPIVFLSSRGILVIGGALLCAFLFYHRAWVAMAWFGTHTFLWTIAAGNIDMYVVGLGLLLLVLSDECSRTPVRVLLRVAAYGFLLVKPQGGILIVLLYILLRRDWLGVAISVVVYGLFFAPLYPAWIEVLRTDPPAGQIKAAHSLGARFSPVLSVPVALLVLFSRRWTYWQLGAALASILSPYGMPGIPILLVLTSLNNLAIIPAWLIYSGCLAVLTWIAPQSPIMGVYHLGMLGLALILACLSPDCGSDKANSVDLRPWLQTMMQSVGARLHERRTHQI